MREAPLREQARRPGAVRDFGVRTITALIIGAVLIVADLWGPTLLVWGAVVAAIAVPCALEFYRMMRTERRKPNEVFGVIAAAVMPLAAALYAMPAGARGATTASQAGALGLTAVAGALLVAALVWHILFRQVTASDTATTVFGAMYTGFMLAHLVLLRALDSGAELVIVVLVSVWAMDVFAYLVGTAVGRHRLAPHISPKKSWEGFVAGAVGTVAAWSIGWWVTRPALGITWYVLTGVVVAVAALLGDLAESRLKREVAVKDSGSWLPGHGGFLDRFDSMILVSVVAYYMLVVGGAR